MKDITTEEAVKDLKHLVEEYKNNSIEGLNMIADVEFNEDRCKKLEKVLNELDKEKLKNQFIMEENLEDIYEKTLEKVIGKHVSNVILKGGIPRDKLNELIDKYENEIKNDGVLTKLDTYSALRAVINDLKGLIEPKGLNEFLEEE